MSKIKLELTNEELEDVLEAVEKQRYSSYLSWLDKADTPYAPDNKYSLKAKRLVKIIEKIKTNERK